MVVCRPCARRGWLLQTRRLAGLLLKACLPSTSMQAPGQQPLNCCVQFYPSHLPFFSFPSTHLHHVVLHAQNQWAGGSESLSFIANPFVMILDSPSFCIGSERFRALKPFCPLPRTRNLHPLPHMHTMDITSSCRTLGSAEQNKCFMHEGKYGAHQTRSFCSIWRLLHRVPKC